MELLTALPVELAAIADPSARAAAPLRGSAAAEGCEFGAGTLFAACLALLTTPFHGGEIRPAAGKDLPPEPLVPVTESTDSLVDPAAVLALSSAAVPEATMQVSLHDAPQPQTDATPASVAIDVDRAAGPLPPLASRAPPLAVVPSQASEAADLGPLAALATGNAEPVPLAATSQPAAPEVNAQSVEPSSWFETSAGQEHASQRSLDAALDPDVPAALDPDAPAAPTRSAAAAVSEHQPPLAVSANAAEKLAALRRIEPLKAMTSAADSAGVATTDWLAPAAELRSAATAVAPPVAAAAGAGVDTRSANWHEAFANRIQWLVDQQVGEAHIKLNPPELGAVDVKISLVDDQTFVQLTTATAAARDELAQGLPRLRELFTVSGLELGGASVHNGRDGQQAASEQRGNAEPAPARSFPAYAEGGDELRAPGERRPVGRIDVFA